jgi:DNA-binding transcriptional LysR family regulator
MIDFTRLRYFLAVADQLHYRKAAEGLGLTQSALSQQIVKLEHEYKVELFIRSGRTVQLTPAGKNLQKRARKVLVEVAKLEDELRAHSHEGRVRMGYLEYQNLDFIHRTLRAFAADGSKVRLEPINFNSDQIAGAVIDGKIDLGIVHLPVKNGDLQVTTLIRGHWGFVMPAKHPLASKARLEPEDLVGEKLLLFKKDLNPQLYNRFLDSFKKTKSKPKIALHLTQSAQGPKLVSAGAGLFLTATYVVQPLPSHLVMRPYSGLGQEIELGLVWRKRPSDPIRTVIDELKKEAKR